MKIGQEATIQIQVVEFVKQTTDIPVIHIANERKCNPQHGAILKRMGVLAGVSDLFFPRGNGQYPGMFMELKAPNGKLSIAQANFLCARANDGYYCCVCYNSEDAINEIKEFYHLAPLKLVE